MSDFGPVLRGFRKAAGLSQEVLAAAAGVSVEGIRALETGRRRRPRPATLALLSDGLGLTDDQRAELVAAGSRPVSRGEEIRQLPDDLDDFSGREQQVAEIEKVLGAPELRPGVVLTSAVSGMGGVGKTTLAVHVAHRLADRYPDGQLYLNLRGFGPGRPMPVEQALGQLMSSLGVGAPEDPQDVAATASRYRSALAGRRVLVLLDNAADAAQVAPLLPGTSTCAVLITSRRKLSALPGVARVALDVLPDYDALALLSLVVGGGRIAADPVGALSIVRLCGGLPLALRVVGARLAAEPAWTVADLVERLESSRRRLDEFSIADLDVRASIEFSLAAAAERDADAVGTFRLLGLHQGNELDARVAAALLDLPVAEVEDRLERLVDLHLLDSPAPQRYRMHDLIRSFVQETTAELTDEPAREAARLRVLRLYSGMVWQSRSPEPPGWLAIDWFEASWTAGAERVPRQQAYAWFDEEFDEIVGAVRRAAGGTTVERAEVARVVFGLLEYTSERRRYSDGVMLGTLALTAERTVGDPYAAGVVAFELAQQCGAAGLYSLAIEHMETALAAPKMIECETQYRYGQIYLGDFLVELGHCDEAIASAGLGIADALRHGDEIAEAEGRLVLGTAAGKQGRTDAQDQNFHRAVDVMRRLGHRLEVHWALWTAGVSYREVGRYDEALTYFEECRAAAVANGDEFGVAEALEQLGRTQLELGDLETAEEHLLAALETMQGTWQSEARVREHLGRVFEAAGRPDQAVAQWRSALDLLARHGAPRTDELRALLTGHQ
ncbi:XRE family transcriptional regulator [Kribbella sp. CA-293567]|uniref:XRE family transcriptional regulator n=1 Tax=Kribbella sp. CA-293567 TaxID=3002436 RepID=UPI0022DD921D|nr:XRE family transcriptional regulator [Kribbella sp. CA-293567]WBQ04082.1 tetratricopeptide repeat protein [Kribbella sp. CA-293567]